MMLPQMSDRSMMRPVVRTGFGGLNSNLNAQDGEIVWMENMSSREYPLLTPRPQRGAVQEFEEPYSLGAQDVPFWVDADGFFYDGVREGTVSRGKKQFAVIGNLIVIVPDKKYYDFKADVFGSLAIEQSFNGVSFINGTYKGVPAVANTIYKAGAAWTFAAGDAVTITGCETHPENNQTVIVREVEGDYLRFYENTFTLDTALRYRVGEDMLRGGTYHFLANGVSVQYYYGLDLNRGAVLEYYEDHESTDFRRLRITPFPGAEPTVVYATVGNSGDELQFEAEGPEDYTEAGEITLAREVPDLDYICVNENRLWGCKGDTIYASAQGDPFNFNVFDGLSTDSWQSDTTDAGDFTGCYSFQGYPIFFKEDSIFKVQGDSARNFAWTRTDRLGVKAGCAGSLAVAGETLFYCSRVGICVYQGGMPRVISDPLGANTRWDNAVGGSDGLRYYVSMEDGEANFHLFTYDTRYGTWHREDSTEALGFAFWDGGLYMMGNNHLWRMDGTEGSPEGTLDWQVKFADTVRAYETTDTGSQNKKGPLRILIRATLGKSSTITVKIKYDDGSTRTVGTLEGSDGKKKSYILPMILRRCDHYRLSLDGVGDAVIYSLTVEQYNGSQFQASRDVELLNG